MLDSLSRFIRTIGPLATCALLSLSACDTVSPAINNTQAPTLSLLSPSGASGTSANLSIEISGLPPGFGTRVALYQDSSCATNEGSFSTNGIADGVLGVTLTQAGLFTLYAETFDGLSQTWSPCSSTGISYTLLAPAAPTGLSLSTPSSSPGYVATPAIWVSGVSAAGKVWLFTDSACTQQIGNANSFGVGSVLVTASALALGSYTIYAQTISSSGIASPCSTASLSYTLQAPPVPTALAVQFPFAPPYYSLSPTILVSGAGSNITVKVYKDALCTQLLGTGTSLGGTATISTSALTLGSTTIYASTVSGGLSSACSSASIVYNLVRPASPTTLTLITPASSPNYYQTPTVQVAGVNSGLTVGLYTDSGCTSSVATGNAVGSTINLTSTISLPLGVTTLYASQASSGGTVSLCSTANLSYTVTSRWALSTFHQYTINSYEGQVAAGDFNGDGKLDLVSANYQATGVSLLMGNGDGTFQPQVVLSSLGNYTSGVAVADINGDGKLDLLVNSAFSPTLLVYLGDGSGGFSGPVTFVDGPISEYGGAIAVADFNGDGKADVVVTGTSGHLSVLFGNGDGSFQTHTDYTGVYQNEFVATGDLNGDGFSDIVVTGGTVVSVFMNNGNGTFAPKVDYNLGAYGTSVALQDLNGDGKLDIVAGLWSSGFAVLLGNGNGTFGAPSTTAVNGGLSAAVGDIDGDGKLDVVTENSTGYISVFFGKGDGTFDLNQNFAYAAPGILYGNHVFLGDFNSDGALDVAAPTNSTHSISILMNLKHP